MDSSRRETEDDTDKAKVVSCEQRISDKGTKSKVLVDS